MSEWRAHQKVAQDAASRMRRGIANAMPPTETSDVERMKDERLGILRTLLEQRKQMRDGTNETEKSIVPASVATLVEGQPQCYSDLLATFDIIGSDSMKLIDSSVTQLHDAIKTAHPVEACMLASTIAKLLRLKLDVRKVGKE